jgi:hypothetical protein
VALEMIACKEGLASRGVLSSGDVNCSLCNHFLESILFILHLSSFFLGVVFHCFLVGGVDSFSIIK